MPIILEMNDTSTYSVCLITWANQVYHEGGPLEQVLTYTTDPVYNNVNYGGDPFNNGVDSRAFLVKPVAEGGGGWTITGDTLV